MKLPLFWTTMLTLSALCGSADADGTGTVRGSVNIAKGHVLESVVIYVEGENLPTVQTKGASIAQENKQFQVPVLPIVRGSTVAFPNKDRVMHNVFSPTSGFQFDLGYYKKGTSKSVVFKKKGTVDIYCDIHPGMVTTVLVLDNGFFARPDAKGNYEIRGLPPGKYKLTGWLSYGEPGESIIEVRANQTIVRDFDLPNQTRTKKHRRKDGTPYGRYR